MFISCLSEGICKQINFQISGISAIPIVDITEFSLWKETDYYENYSTVPMDILISDITPYNGLGNINTYNQFFFR